MTAPQGNIVSKPRAPENPIARVGPDTSLADMAKMFAESGFFKDSRSVAQAGVKILAGRELNIPPVAAMTGIFIVKDKVMVGATVLAACVQRSGRFEYRVKRLDDTGCVLEFFDRGESVGVSTFTAREATQAGLAGSQTYRAYPRNMYFSRALSNGVKWYCPGVTAGPVYTPEELGVPTNAAGEPVVREEDDAPAPSTRRRSAADIIAGPKQAPGSDGEVPDFAPPAPVEGGTLKPGVKVDAIREAVAAVEIIDADTGEVVRQQAASADEGPAPSPWANLNDWRRECDRLAKERGIDPEWFDAGMRASLKARGWDTDLRSDVAFREAAIEAIKAGKFDRRK